VILVHSKPGVGPKLHRHPYPEVFVVESGQATFRIGDESVIVEGGHVVVSPSGEAHGFTNTGTGELRLTAIHASGRFNTEWLEGPDATGRPDRRRSQTPAAARSRRRPSKIGADAASVCSSSPAEASPRMIAASPGASGAS
jgi:uncharacterized cupin superfamily protein